MQTSGDAKKVQGNGSPERHKTGIDYQAVKNR